MAIRRPPRSVLAAIAVVLAVSAILAVTVATDPPETQAAGTTTTGSSQGRDTIVAGGTTALSTSPGSASTGTSGPGAGATTTTSEGGTTATTSRGTGSTSTASTATTGSTTTVAPSTTTTTQSTTTTSRPVSGGTVGYIGCSNTADTVKGYSGAGGGRFWPPDSSYGGGTVVNWSTSTSYWQSFNAHLSAQPTTIFWWQICARTDETDAELYEASLDVLATLASNVSGATVYLSALNGWVDPHICGQVGPGGEERIGALVARLLNEGRALRGPTLPDLFGQDSAGNGATETRADGCHPNSLGESKLGASLLSFFGS
jgi:hypothetical protein